MTAELPQSEAAAIESIVRRLETAWNAGDGDAFAAPFATDADFVNIRAEPHRGREAIAAGHRAIFRTIYAGSTNRCAMESARLLRPDVALARVLATLDCPTGPLTGRHRARFTMVLTKGTDGWEIASFHNTLEPAQQTARQPVA
jgi:uncharacterized protein (TIGR02246 family)